MSDQKPADQKPAEQKAAAPKAPPPVVLGDAAASTNPVVQNLLAHREIAVSNGDDAAARAVDARLAELGVA